MTAISSNPALIPNPTVSYTSANGTGTLTFTPVADANGTATDHRHGQRRPGLATTPSRRTLHGHGQPVNDPPTLDALNPVTLNEDAPAQTVTLTGISAGAGQRSRPAADRDGVLQQPGADSQRRRSAYTSPNGTGTLTFTPVADAFGTATITVTVNDGQGSNNTVTRTFTVTVSSGQRPADARTRSTG